MYLQLNSRVRRYDERPLALPDLRLTLLNLQLEHLDPLAPAAQAADADRGQGHTAAAFLGGGGSRQDDDFGLALQACTQFLDPGRRVHAVADDSVVDPAGRADIADDHRAAVQADSHPDRRQPDGAAL